MKKFAFLSFLFFAVCINSNAEDFFYNHTPVHSYNYKQRLYPAIHDDMSALEKYTLNKRFSRESDLARLQRLEMQAFGAIQPGDFSTRYQNVRSAILARPKQNYKTSVMRGIGDYFAGQMTGFTPSINSYPLQNIYPSNPIPYETQNQSFYSTPFGGGYRINGYGSGSGCGVHILD